MSELFYHNDNGDRLSNRCNKRKCGLCILTCVLSIGIYFLVLYLVNHWGKLEHIS